MTIVKPAYTIFAPKKPNRGIFQARIKFTDTGNIYDVTLIEKEVAVSLVDSSSSNFLAVPGLILVDEASLEKIKSILGELVDSGYFDSLAPVEN